MVSRNRSFFSYILIPFMAMTFLVLLNVAGYCSIPCCKGTVLSTCPDLPNGQQYDISKCSSIGGGIKPECSPGVTDSKNCGNNCPEGDCYLEKDCSFRCWTLAIDRCLLMDVAMSKCTGAGIYCLSGQTCQQLSDCSYECAGNAKPICFEQDVAMSKCTGAGVYCLSGQTCRQLSDCSYKCVIPKVCAPGDKQYKPSGSCNTQVNTCCSNGQWSGYGLLCTSFIDNGLSSLEGVALKS